MGEQQQDTINDCVRRKADQEAGAALGELSPVSSLFNGRSVFITGASGFIGRVLLEKLLRSYPVIKNIYILMRAKKNVQPADRLNRQLLNAPIFDTIRAMKNGQDLLDKIIVITGDIGEDNLGISKAELNLMLEDPTLGIVFHSAATVRFDEPLKTSVKFNLAAVETLIRFCKRIPNLVALCHVSSAYVNSNIKNNQDIKEQLYPVDHSPRQVLRLAAEMDERLMQEIKPTLVGQRPNTYTYTKALGEHLIALEASGLPVAIVRPSIVVASWREPIPGWIDNLNGPTGLLLAYGKGLMRTMYAKRTSKADIVPVDIVVNCMIAAAYYAASTSGKLDPVPSLPPQLENAINKRDKPFEDLSSPSLVTGCADCSDDSDNNYKVPPIFHCTSGDLNPFTWGDMERIVFPHVAKYPSEQVLRHPGGTFKDNPYFDAFMRPIVHYLPALIIDLICLLMGKKLQLLSIYRKLHAAMDALNHFSTTNYNFKSNNIKHLQAYLAHPEDRQTLYMDITKLNWDSFYETYVLGVRRFVLKESDETFEKSRRSFRRAYYKELVFRLVLTALALFVFMPLGMRLVKQAIVSVSPTQS